MTRARALSFVVLALCLLTGLAWSPNSRAERLVEAVGSAPIINGAVVLARQQAIQDAIEQAMLQTAARVDSTSTIAANVLVIESSRVNAAGTVEDVEVIDQWRDNEVLYVRIRARVPLHKLRKPSPAARYRKKIAVLQFDVEKRTQIADLPGIERALPREILRRLELTGAYLGIDGSQYLASDTRPGYRFDNPAVYVKLARKLGAQILLSGIIRDMGVNPGLFGLLNRSRHLEIELFLHDGLSGARIARYRFSENVAGGHYFAGHSTLFSNAAFLQTDFGKALDRMLQRQVTLVHQELEKLPFAARVVEVNGDQIYFDAGSVSRVKPGDVLMTYRLSPDPLHEPQSGRFLGYKETPVATLAVAQTQPNFSRGKLETTQTRLRPGDIIRFGW